ncbi:MAG: response regulator [Deltaproteobacteria bacterium]|nr:response regulator [Deltaproteobacteria bacterium]MBW1922065.1 response regulator [Deltaproteobacteria bacterium]MBW1949820.1 response regulator [Deltaproteobacteria bacterium]MBW2007671.1 response regulator [Deltaproteobacteria bacterium]MBW2103970.1 response regulator [Deltaproteobacteria bacterium]
MSLQKILVVDDEQPITQLIQEGLEMEGGYTVRRASNGREGVELYKNFLPDLVIMDVNMPIMDGYQSSKEIKAFDPDARILVLTGNAQDARARRIMEEGIALTLLQKPLRLWQLARIVQDNLPHPC